MLMVGLAFVGTTMLVMAFVEAATEFKERDLPATYGITISILRATQRTRLYPPPALIMESHS